METHQLSTKHVNGLEQQVMQILKTMQTAKLHNHPIYASLQEFEQELALARRKQYDKDNSEYSGY